MQLTHGNNEQNERKKSDQIRCHCRVKKSVSFSRVRLDASEMATSASKRKWAILWLDAYVNAGEENQGAQQRLTQLCDEFRPFEQVDDCQQEVQSKSKTLIVLIVSGRLSRDIIPAIEHHERVSAMFIYCMDKSRHEQWIKEHPKVKGVHVKLEELVSDIQSHQSKGTIFNEQNRKTSILDRRFHSSRSAETGISRCTTAGHVSSVEAEETSSRWLSERSGIHHRQSGRFSQALRREHRSGDLDGQTELWRSAERLVPERSSGDHASDHDMAGQRHVFRSDSKQNARNWRSSTHSAVVAVCETRLHCSCQSANDQEDCLSRREQQCQCSISQRQQQRLVGILPLYTVDQSIGRRRNLRQEWTSNTVHHWMSDGQRHQSLLLRSRQTSHSSSTWSTFESCLLVECWWTTLHCSNVRRRTFAYFGIKSFFLSFDFRCSYLTERTSILRIEIVFLSNAGRGSLGALRESASRDIGFHLHG